MILSVQTEGFSSDAKILAIGVKRPGVLRIWKSWEFPSEREMLADFVKYFLGTQDKIVIGFNNLKLDMPLLLLRSRELPEFPEFFKKFNYANVEDLFLINTFINRGIIKGLDYYCRKEGIPCEFSDREMLAAYQAKDYGKFEEMFRKKLDALDSLFLKMWEKVTRV
jgi:predicted PolB exonuclease-like 3'-5' exonuclease